MDQTISKGFIFLEDAPELICLLENIFTGNLMQEHTRFESLESSQYSSAMIINWKADILIYVPPLLDASARKSTDFAVWDEMVRSVADLHYRR